MRIVIDARMYQESGVGRYIRNLISELQILEKENEYLILLTKKDYDNLDLNKNFKKVLANFRWYGVEEQIKLPKLLKELKPDLVHFPHFNIPIFYKGKFIVTIHDLIHQHFQMKRATTLNPLTYKIKQLAYKKVFKKAIVDSKKILVPSNYVKNLLVKDWDIDANRVVVTYEAVDEDIFSIAKRIKRERINQVMKKFRIRPPFLFYVGNAHPHKNVEGLIRAFLELRKKYPYLQLVLSGHDHYFWQKLKGENQHKDIIYTGFITDEELVALYRNAQCFVLPSFEEGFGIPLLESMACNCPVVSSNKGSLPEIGGEATLYFNPHNLIDIKEKISQILDSQKIRNSLIEEGKKRVLEFSWKTLAKKTLDVYQNII